jgi:hypothetical protein
LHSLFGRLCSFPPLTAFFCQSFLPKYLLQYPLAAPFVLLFLKDVYAFTEIRVLVVFCYIYDKALNNTPIVREAPNKKSNSPQKWAVLVTVCLRHAKNHLRNVRAKFANMPYLIGVVFANGNRLVQSPCVAVKGIAKLDTEEFVRNQPAETKGYDL